MFSFFKTVKSEKEGKTRVICASVLALILIAGAVVLSVLGAGKTGTTQEFLFIGALVCVLVAVFFCSCIAAVCKNIKRFKNVHCDGCKKPLSAENATWENIGSAWEGKEGHGHRLKVNVSVKVVCPDCGKEKTFEAYLHSELVSKSENDDVTLTKKLVEKFFANEESI